jgi:hypothetical protein
MLSGIREGILKDLGIERTLGVYLPKSYYSCGLQKSRKIGSLYTEIFCFSERACRRAFRRLGRSQS